MQQDQLKEKVNRYLINETQFLKIKDTMTEDQLRLFVDEAIVNMCRDQNILIPADKRMEIIRDCVSAVVSMGPLRPLMEDKGITEIMINGANKIYIQKSGQITLSDVKFKDNNHLLHTIQKMLVGSGSNKRVDESSPY